MLSEHTLQGWLQGYTMTGRHGVFPSYEAFLGIVATLTVQYTANRSLSVLSSPVICLLGTHTYGAAELCARASRSDPRHAVGAYPCQLARTDTGLLPSRTVSQ
ncbi:D-xylulose 5-phosphate/D-fructose 6-phosphate phosphoketolase-domain-containing protein [Rhodotorula diobovata]|uniref:D-xylulose 5-phosphate/D-fructose 6-phosphate phosphoketolase-domain-containing protein n=1 Tax=Rhodotorula diobovata TaxID=5288 RepID=A0A5C5FX13_9BASI|nr:D-xylulose 5-phosphate/D-fructose 6-phosphate phosphoketolase-domain-containing protein [Rhodotorula diobovata]